MDYTYATEFFSSSPHYHLRNEEFSYIDDSALISPSLSSTDSATIYLPIDSASPPIKSELRSYSEGSDESHGVSCCEQTPVKRPRGRPRKCPDPNAKPPEKLPKVRSKTGCLTCRKRKKKCDETKPVCLKCQKNNAICEGYPPREIWQGGKPSRRSSQLPQDFPTLVNGVETDSDRKVLDHFTTNLCRAICLSSNDQNPFGDIILPMAMGQWGLMQSVLCLAGSHLSHLDNDPTIPLRRDHHFDCSIKYLGSQMGLAASSPDEHRAVDDAAVASVMALVLKTMVCGEADGEYRAHMGIARHLFTTQQSPNAAFQDLFAEFFVYHEICNSVTSLDRRSSINVYSMSLRQLVHRCRAPAYVGVVDGLLSFFPQVTALRDEVRAKRNAGSKPIGEYFVLTESQRIEEGLRRWTCSQPQGSPQFILALLYRQCIWVYLSRTVLPSVSTPELSKAVELGLEYLQQLEEDVSMQAVLAMPIFLLGCAAFENHQRQQVFRMIGRLYSVRRMNNLLNARVVLRSLWAAMDRHSEEESWDWESMMSRLRIDCLIA